MQMAAIEPTFGSSSQRAWLLQETASLLSWISVWWLDFSGCWVVAYFMKWTEETFTNEELKVK